MRRIKCTAKQLLAFSFPTASGSLVQDPGAEALQGLGPDHLAVRDHPAVSTGRQVAAAPQQVKVTKLGPNEPFIFQKTSLILFSSLEFREHSGYHACFQTQLPWV